MSTQRTSLRLIATCISLLNLCASNSFAQTERNVSCTEARVIAVNETIHQGHPQATSKERYIVDLPGPGVLSVRVSNPSGDGGVPVLSADASVCQAGSAKAVHRPIRQTPRSLLKQAVTAGTLGFVVASEEPRAGLPPFKLQVKFSETKNTADAWRSLEANPPETCAVPSAPALGEDPFLASRFVVLDRNIFSAPGDDVEPIDCDILDGSFPQPGVVTIDAEGIPLAAALFEGRACDSWKRVSEGELRLPGSTFASAIHAGTHRLTLEPLTGDAVEYSLKVRHFDLCSLGEVDDHGDTPLCATPLKVGDSATGAMDLRIGGDEDFHTFILEEQKTLAIILTGEATLNLSGAEDQRLATVTAEGSPESTNLTRTLGPGRYYLEVTGGSAEEGEYALSLTEVPRP